MKKVTRFLLALASLAAPATAQIPELTGEVLWSEKISRGNVGDQFGRSLDLLGDLDDDGVTDLVVGASHDDDGEQNSGSVWILFLNADSTLREARKISQTNGGFTGTLGVANWFGKALEAIGDLDGDGIEDVAVGAPSDDSSSDRAVYILFLNTDGTVRDHTRIARTTTGFGRSIINVGDQDGDGVVDLAIGTGYGRMYLYYLNSNGTVKSSQTYNERLNSTPGFDTFYAIGGGPIGDFDGDGIPDMAIGDTAADQGGTDAGAMYLSLVAANGTDKQEIAIYDGAPGMNLGLPGYPNFGRDAALISDLDGNGVQDLAIGCSEYYSGNEPEDSGAVFIAFLNPNGSVIDHRKISRRSGTLGHALNAFNEFGIALAPIGDKNGDGTIDIAVGARFDGSGSIYLAMINDGTLEPADARSAVQPQNGPAPLVAVFEDRSRGSVTGWLWDFGDGESSTEQHPTHTYRDEGVYDVTLYVTGPYGIHHSKTWENRITVTAPTVSVADLDADPREGLDPLQVDFTDLSVGDITSWFWDFDDGNTSTLQHPTHTYTAPGNYTPTLDVDGPTGSDSASLSSPIVVHAAVVPTAGFTADGMGGIVPYSVTFTDASSGFIDSRSWDFGDGNSSTEVSPTHEYTMPGSFTVSLTVGNAAGNDTYFLPDPIFVNLPPAPVANFDSNPNEGSTPLVVSFTDISTGPPDSWLWDFGDGATSTQQDPMHSYLAGGTYDVSLTVSNAGGMDTWTLNNLVATTQTIDITPFNDGTLSQDDATGTGYIMYSQEPIQTRFGGALLQWDPADHFITVKQISGDWYYDDNVDYQPLTPRSTDILVAAVDFDADTAMVLVGTSGTIDGIASGYTSGDLVITPQMWAGGFNDGEFTPSGTHITIGGETPAPTPAFQASPTSGAAPLNVVFTDQSTGSPTSWFWDFGDGGNSTLQNPSHDYTAEGTYTVSLTASNPGGGNTRTEIGLIEVMGAAPTADFVADTTSGPAPLDVQFTDLSTGSPTSWSWTFGDGGSSSLQNPSHTYAAEGTYTVELTATNAGGSDVLTRTDYIQATGPPPTADFTVDSTMGPAPLTVQFTDLSTDGPTGWSWTFGDGGSSTQQNPSHTYLSPGNYTVSLTASNANGADMFTLPGQIVVTVPPPVAGFTADTTSGPAPLAVQFTDLSSGSPTSWSWTFGDGGSSSLQNPQHTYTDPGDYTVSLTATNAGGPDNSTVVDYINVTVPPPAASFTLNPGSGPAPLDVQFTDTSTGTPTSWSWTFGDGGTSTLQNPQHTYTTPDTYTVSLTATNAGGPDVSTQVDAVVVLPPAPTADFTADTTSGPAPLAVQFTDTSTDAPTSWSWTFGDGGSSTLQNPQHTYTVAGDYTVALTATNASGGDTLTRTDYVSVAPPVPTASFTADVTSGPAPLDVQFTDTSTDAPTSWSWTFGDGGSSTLQHPQHTYATPGTYTVVLTATNASGSDIDTQTDLITAGPPAPTADFTSDTTSGPAPLTVQFTDTSTDDPTSWSWTFGDGGTSSEQNPSYEYLAPGTFTVALTATNANGSDTLTRAAYIAVGQPAPTASFTADTTAGPAPLTVQFTDTSTDAPTSWSWDFGDGGSSTEQNPQYTYTGAGTFTVELTATNAAGSDVDTQTDLIMVGPPAPTADFSADPTSGPASLNVQFTDLSTDVPTSWSWDFGDGGNSTLQHPSHLYTTPGTYSVELTATNASGADALTRTDYIVVGPRRPTASFFTDITSGAAPLTIQFTDSSTDEPTSWSWTFGDGNSSTEQNPQHSYEDPGTYTVSLTATNASGSDILTLPGLIEANDLAPTADFTADTTAGPAPLTVQFTDTSTDTPTSWSWTFGDGGTSTEQNPQYTYDAEGTYTVALTATNPAGFDTLTRTDYVTVDPPAPTASFSSDVTSGPAPLTVQFVDLSTDDPTSWSWTFGDGDSSTEQNPEHTYTGEGTFTVALTATNASGSDTLTAADYITATGPAPTASFTVDTNGGPAPLTVQFTDTSTDSPTSWSWNFGDGNGSTEQNPEHTYAEGSYSPTLTATNAAGSDAFTLGSPIVVTGTPPVAEFSVDVATGPAPLAVQFTDLSTGLPTSWSWDFGDGEGSTEQHPQHTYLTGGTYTVALTATSGAGSDTETKTDLVVVGVPVDIVDGGFEGATPGGPPAPPWTVLGGTGHRVLPDGFPGDNGLPTEGGQWLELSAEGSVATTPPAGGAGVSQSFTHPAGSTLLSFDASFLLDGDLMDGSFNDWMSIDVDDGSSTENLFYRDTFSTFAEVSEGYAFPMTTVESVEVDLAALFPGSDTSTVFTLTLQVGNGGDGLRPSKGYVDDVRLASAAPTLGTPYGCGVNPEGSLTVLSGTASLGTLVVFGVDNPLGTQAPGSIPNVLCRWAPDPAYPCGSLIPNRGMAGPGADGERLTRVGPRPFRSLFGPAWQGPGIPAEVELTIPNKLSLIGRTLYSQGRLIDSGGAIEIGFTNAIEFDIVP